MKTASSILLAFFWFFVFCALCLTCSSCSSTSITKPDGTVIAHTSVATDAVGVWVTDEGITYAGLNQSRGTQMVGRTISTNVASIGMTLLEKARSADDVARLANVEKGNTARNASNNAVETTRIIESETTARAALEVAP